MTFLASSRLTIDISFRQNNLGYRASSIFSWSHASESSLQWVMKLDDEAKAARESIDASVR
jgi:hypothetical protein